ncbi:MAG: hypothetical protein ACXVAX_08280 [Pseudobdellovibrio sp.]
MKRLIYIAILSTILGAPAYAGKVDTVKKAVKDSCNKELPDSDLMEAIVKAYDCTAGTSVKVADCKISCLKENGGFVVGK